VSLHTWRYQCPCKPSSCATFTLNSHWGRASTRQKMSHMYAHRVTSVCPTLCDPVDCSLPGFSVKEGGSPGKNTGAYWPIRVAIPFSITIFPAALAANSPKYLGDPCDPRSCTTSTPGPHRGKPHPPGQPQEQTPVDNLHAEVEIKP